MSEQGRTTTVRVEKCPTCMARDVDTEHVQRCKVFTEARKEAIAHGRGGLNIHAQRTGDLWAHVNSRTDDPAISTAITNAVIDLGWRPVIGRDNWTAPEPPTSELTPDAQTRETERNNVRD